MAIPTRWLALLLVTSACARSTVGDATDEASGMSAQPATDADGGLGDDPSDPADGRSNPEPSDDGTDEPGTGGDGGDRGSGDDGASCPALSADCASGLVVGTLIGTKRSSVSGFPEATQEIDHRGQGSGWLRVRVVDEFNAFGDFDFDNLVGLRAKLIAPAGSKYRVTVTGGATELCGTPYEKHVVETDASGIAEVESLFGRFSGMPPLSGSVVNDYGELAIQIEQLEGDCNESFVLQIQGHPCSSNCAFNTATPCNDETEPKVCAEVTD